MEKSRFVPGSHFSLGYLLGGYYDSGIPLLYLVLKNKDVIVLVRPEQGCHCTSVRKCARRMHMHKAF